MQGLGLLGKQHPTQRHHCCTAPVPHHPAQFMLETLISKFKAQTQAFNDIKARVRWLAVLALCWVKPPPFPHVHAH